MHHLWSILLLATVQYGLTSDNLVEMTLCKDKDLTLSLSQNVQRRAVVASDHFPVSAKTTCTIRVNFDTAATVNLTLTTTNIWKKLKPSTDAQGYVLEYTNGEKKLVFHENIPEGSSAWTNASSNLCPYLYVWRVSATRSGDALQSIFNGSTTLNTTGIVIELRSVPETAWCDISISINASPMPGDYCQAKEQLYCNSSVQCLNSSLRCDGLPDCDNGEDEMNCSKVADGFTEGFAAEGMTVSISVTICVVVLLMTAVVAFLTKRRHIRSRRKDDNCDYSYSHQAGANITESTKLSYLIDNDMYSPSPQRPDLLKVSASEPVYYVLESQCDRTSVSHAKSSE